MVLTKAAFSSSMKAFFKRLRLAWQVLKANEVIVVAYDDDGLHYHHDGASLVFLHVFMKIVGNAKLWMKEWTDLNAIN